MTIGTQRPHQRPKCLDPIRMEAARFVLHEKARRRLYTADLAASANLRPRRLANDLGDLARGDIDGKGLEYLFRLVKALDHDVVVSFVPRKKGVAA
jgi:hypothetical protein